MKKPTKRRAFSFLRSYFDVLNEIPEDKDKLEFLLAVINKQFLDQEPEGLGFISNLCYESQRHTIEQSVKGYKDKMNTDLLGNPIEDPCQGGAQGGRQGVLGTPRQQEKEKEEEKVIYIESVMSPPKGVDALYFFIAKGFHTVFLSKGKNKTLSLARADKWADEVRKIVELDKVPVIQLVAIKYYFELAAEGIRGVDTFWYDTILSLSAFRKKDKDGVFYWDRITKHVKRYLKTNPEAEVIVNKKYNNLMSKVNEQ